MALTLEVAMAVVSIIAKYHDGRPIAQSMDDVLGKGAHDRLVAELHAQIRATGTDERAAPDGWDLPQHCWTDGCRANAIAGTLRCAEHAVPLDDVNRGRL
jgi:hypothetical protein